MLLLLLLPLRLLLRLLRTGVVGGGMLADRGGLKEEKEDCARYDRDEGATVLILDACGGGVGWGGD